LIRFNKEVKAKEAKGEFIVENLLQTIKNRGYSGDKKVVVLNDTVTSLLSGISSFQDREFESYIGFILGTVLNACYIEKNKNIKKKFIEDLD